MSGRKRRLTERASLLEKSLDELGGIRHLRHGGTKVISLHTACFAQEESCLGIVDLLPTGVDVPAQLIQTMLKISLK